VRPDGFEPPTTWLSERARGIGNMLNAALHKKQAKSLVPVIKCEHYVTVLVTYDDGSLKSLDLTKMEGSNTVDRTAFDALLEKRLPQFTGT
jgi:hypothetical protein